MGSVVHRLPIQDDMSLCPNDQICEHPTETRNRPPAQRSFTASCYLSHLRKPRRYILDTERRYCPSDSPPCAWRLGILRPPKLECIAGIGVPRPRGIQKGSASKVRLTSSGLKVLSLFTTRMGAWFASANSGVIVHCMRAVKFIWYASRLRQIVA